MHAEIRKNAYCRYHQYRWSSDVRLRRTVAGAVQLGNSSWLIPPAIVNALSEPIDAVASRDIDREKMGEFR